MTDRELLEMAAKALGLEGAEYKDMDGWGESRYGFSNAIWSPSLGEYWNPLVSDGDAFRLAVKLFITITHDIGMDTVIAVFPKYPPAIENAAQDSCAAARRAIVRVAAEIGRKM